MKELKAILKAYRQLTREGKQLALATVVRVEGSAYRRPGARMLVTEDGQAIGSISGGCLETDAIRKARHVMQTGTPQLVTYDTLDDDDTSHGVGLGCNGVVQVLIQPFSGEAAARQVQQLTEVVQNRVPAVLATVFQAAASASPGDYLLLTADAVLASALPLPAVGEAVLRDARTVLTSGRSVSLLYPASGELALFVEMLEPAQPLVIVGGGNDAMPLVRLGKEMGWHVTVVDGRQGFATPARFPEADGLVVARPEQVPGQLALTAETAVVLLTHNYNYDLALLKLLAAYPLRYLGMLGPRRRTTRMLAEWEDTGQPLPPDLADRLHSPIGLDLGAETPEEIALAIVAEIQKTRSGRSGQELKERERPIHADDGKPPGDFSGKLVK